MSVETRLLKPKELEAIGMPIADNSNDGIETYQAALADRPSPWAVIAKAALITVLIAAASVAVGALIAKAQANTEAILEMGAMQ